MNQVISAATPISMCERVVIEVAALQAHHIARDIEHQRRHAVRPKPSITASSPPFHKSGRAVSSD